MKSLTDESIDLAQSYINELSLAVKEKLDVLDEDIEEGRKRSMAIMAEAEKGVVLKGEEEVEKLLKEEGARDKLNLLNAKLNNDSGAGIMKNATSEAKSIVKASERSLALLKEEVEKVRGCEERSEATS